MNKLLVFTGNSNPALAKEIARRLEMSLSEATKGLSMTTLFSVGVIR